MLASLLLPVLLAAPVEAKKPKVIERITAEEVADLARAAGGAVELDTDKVGDPLLKVRTGDINYVVLFYGCEASACQIVQFRAFWQGAVKSPEEINERMQKDWFGRMYLDKDGDLTFEHVVDLRGGSSVGSVAFQLEQYVRKAGQVGR